jgi:DNA-binding MarR family transcriptional regulator
LAERAQITQQAMGKFLKDLERLGYIARDIDGKDRRAKKIRLTELGLQLVRDSMEVVEQVRGEYALKIGTQDLNALEAQLARCVDRIALDYLPESWIDPLKTA